eukprot:4197537-Pyramimonas_sp.AAC.1
MHKPDGFQPPEARRRGGGGAWRAFIYVTDVGFYRDFKAMAERYRSSSDEARAEFVALGAAGTDQHREDPSNRSFGPTQGDIR